MQEIKQEKSPIKERILQYLNLKGITKYSFYKKSGVSRGILDQKTGISEDNIARFLEYARDISPLWLITGEGTIFKTKSTEYVTFDNGNKKGNNLGNKPKVQKMLPSDEPKFGSFLKDNQGRTAGALLADEGIPLIPLDAVAGFCSGNGAQVMEYECEKYVVPSFRDAEFLISVKGSSMYPKYSSGDIVACRCLALDTFFQWNKVYVVDTDQGVLIKRVRRGPDDDHIMLVSENERYEPFVLHRRDIHALAIVIGVIRLE